MKTREQISVETRAQGKIPRSANYEYGKKIAEWDAALPNTSQLTRDDFIRSVEPRNDRILVQLIAEPQASSIVLTDHKPLIGGCRKARVLKTGPGKWIEGEWWNVTKELHAGDGKHRGNLLVKEWRWFPGYRRPVSVLPGQIVLIGNWVDLELEDICLCQELDIRAIIGVCDLSNLQVKKSEDGQFKENVDGTASIDQLGCVGVNVATKRYSPAGNSEQVARKAVAVGA